MNKRAIGKANEVAMLKTIANCGWTTAPLCADWTFPERTKNSRRTQGRVILKRLREAGLVKTRETFQAAEAYILTKKGADFVNTQLEADGYKGWAHHGNDLGVLEFNRHVLAIDYVAEKLRLKECAGAIGPAGLRAGIGGGIDADAAYIMQNKNGGYTVVGVLGITNAREAIQQKYKKLARKHKIDLAGDARIIATLQRRIAV